MLLPLSPLALLIGATIVVLILSGIAGYYLWQLKQLREKQQAQRQALEQAGAEQRVRINKSIQIITQAMLEDQMTLTEGAIRTRVLLDGLSVDESVKAEFSAFYQLAAATDHIPILDAWKALSTKKKLVLDSEREKLEKDHKEFVLDAARRIQKKHF